MNVRHICAILGVAIAVGTVTFMQGLVATNDHQAVAVAERLLKEVPVAADARIAQFAVDYRPNGRVMQGPSLVACVAAGYEGERRKEKGESTRGPYLLGEIDFLAARRKRGEKNIFKFFSPNRVTRRNFETQSPTASGERETLAIRFVLIQQEMIPPSSQGLAETECP